MILKEWKKVAFHNWCSITDGREDDT